MTDLSFEELVEKLGSIRGRHTELVSVLIPAGFNKDSVTKQLDAEKSTANNIKSKNTRKNVIDALERIVRYLKTLRKTPANGLALYCGNTSENEGQPNIELFDIHPIQPLNTRIYRCDQTFVVEPLKEMLEVKEVYGLLVIDRKEATVGVLEGNNIKMLRHMTSGVPSKIRAGGQSSARFARITEGMAKEFYRRVAEAMKELFFDMPKLKGIIIGGPMPTKDDFMDEGQLVTKLKDMVIGMKDIGDSDENGLHLLVGASKDLLAEQGIIKEKKVLEKFFEMLGKNPEMTAYKKDNVMKALEYGAVDALIVSKKLLKSDAKKFIDMANNTGARVDLVSADTNEGEQFLNLSGVGAILRYKLQ
ncbi:peptide chain release factor aRF-1 [Candidatus Pacearchaeota archaeon]|nr:peptide chain release factor aRF-1 [Candidatus Pacearchaeota archaeon]